MSLSVVVIAMNEDQMIGPAIASAHFADEVLVVDGGSTDATLAVCENAGVRVIERPFDDFARQRNFALDHAKGDWVFFVDADERVTPELAREVDALVTGDTPGARAYAVPRRAMALGRWLSWHPGGVDAPVRLQRRDAGRWVGAVHEHLEGAGETPMLRAHLVHLTHRSVGDLVAKINAYSEHEAADLVRTGATAPSVRTVLASFPKSLWSLWRSGLRKEGIEGAIEATLLAFNRTLVLAKVWEQTRAEPLAETYRRVDAPGEEAGPTKGTAKLDQPGPDRDVPVRKLTLP